MSYDDEYKITQIDDKTWKVEKEDRYEPREEKPNCDTTFREKVGYKMLRMGLPGKIILILLGDIYGVLYRWGSNMGTAFVLSFAQFLAFFMYFIIPGFTFYYGIEEFLIEMSNDPSILYLIIAVLAFPIIDLLCVIFTGDIRVLGRRHYKDYQD